MTERTFRLSSPNLPAVPSPRVKDPTLQRTHDAVREVIETMRGTRGNQLDRAVFIRDLVATGILSLNAQTGIIGPGPSIDLGGDPTTDTTIPPLLENIVATAGFAHVLLTWNDPNYKPLAFYEVYRLRVNNPNDSPGYTADDARITASELSDYNTLLANQNRTAVQTVVMNALADLSTKTTEYDYAKQYSLLYPNDQALADAYFNASAALKTSRLGVATAQSNNVASAVHVGSTPSPVYSDAVDGGSTYLYWVRAVSTSGIVGPFNAVGVTATTQPDISGIIDELTSEANRGVVTDLIFNGLDNPDNGLSLLENLMDLEALAEQAAEDASSALAASVAGIPTVVWDSIRALYTRLASSAVGSALDQYEQTVDINTLGQRVSTAETTIIQGQSDTAALSGRVDSYATQFDAQFAEVNTALSTLSTADAAFAAELTALEGAVYDPATGAQAAHGRIDDILDLAVSDDSALLTALTQLEASVGEVRGQITDVLSLQIAPNSALAARLTELQLSLDTVSGTVNDLLSLQIAPDSLLAQRLTSFEAQFAATNALVQGVLELDIDQDSVLARALRTLEASVASATGSISDLSYLMVQADNAAALKVSRLEGAVDDAKGQIDDILDLRVSATSALATKLTTLEASVGDSAAKVRDILALNVDATSVLAGKLTELEAQTDYASGAVSDMLSLRFTSDALANSAYANSMQSFQLQLDNLESTVQSYTYNVLNDFTDAYGNLTDPVARAGWGVRVEQTANGVSYISGLGLNQDIYEDSQGNTQAFSEFVVAADRFAVIDPSNPDTANNSPFIVAPDPDDPNGPTRVWIRDAMISRAAIQSLTAGMVVADMVRAGAFIQTANLYTPTINIGTWELTSGADPTQPRSWVYNPASGRQGNFSVDASGIMHATSAVLRSVQIRDYNDNIILDAGNGVYSSAILNDSLYLQAVNGTIVLSGTSNVNNAAISSAALGYRPTAGANVNNWNVSDATVVGGLPTSALGFVHIRLDKTNKHVYVTLRSVASLGQVRAKFELEVNGTTIVSPATSAFVTGNLEGAEVPTWGASALNFSAAASTNVIGPNGLRVAEANGWTVTTNELDQMRFTLGKLDESVEFRLKITEFYKANSGDRGMVVFGDATVVSEFSAAPLEFWFSPRDSAEYDALLLKNGPADAGATNNTVTRSAAAPAGPTNGDIWVDTSVTPNLVKVYVSGAWQISANYLTAGSELSDYSALANANITLNSDGSLNNAGSGFVAPFEPYHAAMWDFRGDAGLWGAANATLSTGADTLTVTGTATANPYIRITHGGMSVPGALFNKVRVKYRRVSGSSSWDGQVFYTTAAHTGFVTGYRKDIAAPESAIVNGKWYISEWDMESLTAGGTDWVDSTITGLRIDFCTGASEVWEVDWVIVGRYGAGEWTINSVNPSNPVTTSNIGTYIAQLAVGTLHMGGNAVTVPNSATSSTTQTLLPGSWTDLLTVAFSVPTVGLSSVDNNIPIILSWAIEADIQNSGAAVRQWQVLKDGVAIYTSNSNLLDTEQFCSGVIKDSINAGATATFKLQGKGVSGVNVYQKSMWVMAARR